MALYSHNGSEPIETTKIRLSDGLTRTDPESWTDEELLDAGVTGPYTIPSWDPDTQTCIWNSTNLQYVVSNKSDEELWEYQRYIRNLKLERTDWTQLPDCGLTAEKIEEFRTYRQTLRDIPANQTDPSNINYPELPSTT